MLTPVSFANIAGAPAVGDVITTRAKLEADGAVELLYRDGKKLFLGFIILHEGEVLGYQNRCPHAGTPLNLYGPNFYNNDKTRLLCATHGAQFDVSSGQCVKGPCKGDWLIPLAITITDDEVLAA